MWPFYHLGVQEKLQVVVCLDSDVFNHRNSSNKAGMDLDILTSPYTINSHILMIFLVSGQFPRLLQLFQYDNPFYCALWKAFSWSRSSGDVKTLPIFVDWMKFKLSQCNPQDGSLQYPSDNGNHLNLFISSCAQWISVHYSFQSLCLPRNIDINNHAVR